MVDSVWRRDRGIDCDRQKIQSTSAQLEYAAECKQMGVTIGRRLFNLSTNGAVLRLRQASGQSTRPRYGPHWHRSSCRFGDHSQYLEGSYAAAETGNQGYQHFVLARRGRISIGAFDPVLGTRARRIA